MEILKQLGQQGPVYTLEYYCMKHILEKLTQSIYELACEITNLRDEIASVIFLNQEYRFF